jgi:hypothetical protein
VTKNLSTADVTTFLTREHRTLFVVGSGVSVSPPASAPSAWKVLEASLDALLDVAFLGTDSLKERVRDRCLPPEDWNWTLGLLPEALYGAIADVYETTAHLELWSALLESVPGDPLCGRPNAGHHALVASAARTGSPILTTNFDCFLEAAAAGLGLVPAVYYPKETGALHREGPARPDFEIWKVHGTAADWRTVRSRASDLSQASRIVQSAQVGALDALFIVGYSGRDFDVFPWVASSQRAFAGHSCGIDWTECAAARGTRGASSTSRSTARAFAVNSHSNRRGWRRW